MRVVVTGASGNVGTAVLRALGADREITEITGIARQRPPTTMAKVTWLSADVTTADLVPVFHLP